MESWTIALRAEAGAPSPYWGGLMHGMLLERLPGDWQEKLHGEGPGRSLSGWSLRADRALCGG